MEWSRGLIFNVSVPKEIFSIVPRFWKFTDRQLKSNIFLERQTMSHQKLRPSVLLEPLSMDILWNPICKCKSSTMTIHIHSVSFGKKGSNYLAGGHLKLGRYLWDWAVFKWFNSVKLERKVVYNFFIMSCE